MFAAALLLVGCNLEPASDSRSQFIGRWTSYSTYDSLDVLDLKVNEQSDLGKSYKFDGIWEFFYYEKVLQRNAGFFTYDEAKKTIYLRSNFHNDDTLVVNNITKNILVFDERSKDGKFHEFHKATN
jgi:hypothetical protein